MGVSSTVRCDLLPVVVGLVIGSCNGAIESISDTAWTELQADREFWTTMTSEFEDRPGSFG